MAAEQSSRTSGVAADTPATPTRHHQPRVLVRPFRHGAHAFHRKHCLGRGALFPALSRAGDEADGEDEGQHQGLLA